jgi:hypothetical protein
MANARLKARHRNEDCTGTGKLCYFNEPKTILVLDFALI